MAIFKCKMCGGTLEVNENKTTATCEYCGSEQTLSKSKEESVQNLFNRANHLRIKCEFDKAREIYEKIVDIDGTDSEAYWGLVLCKYGIEYVEDPKTYKKIPTCHRTEIESLFADVDYQSAIENADMMQKALYEAEAKQIDELQRDILKIANSEEPFDVFICYKETDEGGKRTQDSVLANDLYHQLTNEGFKVFFSRITLEDKLGVAYEPYIFAALNSAKVMVAIGTKPEYFNAVWVKNEWSRYLSLVKKSVGKKILIPAYRDMDPYDLPEEFSHLQAQDMSKLGFMQDLIRGIKKLAPKDEPKPEAPTVSQTVIMQTAQGGSANTTALLKRGQMSLEDGDFQKAKEFFDRVLDMDAECGEAYLGIFLADRGIKSLKEIEKQKSLKYLTDSDYQRVLRFAKGEVKELLDETERNIREQIRLDELEAERKKEEAVRLAAEERQREADERRREEERLAHLKAVREKLAPFRKMVYTGGIPIGITSRGRTESVRFDDGSDTWSDWNGIVSIGSGVYITAGVRVDGSVVIDEDESKKYGEVLKWRDIVKVVADIGFVVGLKTDGTIVAVGEKINKKCVMFEWRDIVDIYDGTGDVYALKSDGTLLKWCGFSNYDEVIFSGVVSCDAGVYALGVKPDGTVVGRWKDIDVSGWTDIVYVACGIDHAVGLKADGTVVATGSNEYGQCEVSDWKDILAVFATHTGTAGLKADGTFLYASTEEKKCDNFTEWKLFDSIEGFEKDYAKMQDVKNKCKSLNAEIDELMKEHATLGLLAGKRKKEIDARVTELKAKIEALIDTL